MRAESPDKDFSTFTPAEEIAEAIAYLCSDARVVDERPARHAARRGLTQDATAARARRSARSCSGTSAARQASTNHRYAAGRAEDEADPENDELRREAEVREHGHREAVVATPRTRPSRRAIAERERTDARSSGAKTTP